MSKEAMEAVLANSKSKGGPRGVLLALAWKTYDRAPPFKGAFTVRYIATLANVQHRQAQADVAALKKLGELVIIGKQGREHVYGVNVALANYVPSDVDNYAVSDADTLQRSANYVPSDVDNYVPSDVDNYVPSDVLTTSHPAYRSYKETRNKNQQEGTPATPGLYHLNGRMAETEEEQTTTPLPPSPMGVMEAKVVWRLILDDLTDQKSKHELDSWHARVKKVAWRDDGALILRGESSLMRFEQFRIAVEYALSRLGAEIRVDYQIYQLPMERKAT